jgi:hypothetical protein
MGVRQIERTVDNARVQYEARIGRHIRPGIGDWFRRTVRLTTLSKTGRWGDIPGTCQVLQIRRRTAEQPDQGFKRAVRSAVLSGQDHVRELAVAADLCARFGRAHQFVRAAQFRDMIEPERVADLVRNRVGNVLDELRRRPTQPSRRSGRSC